MADTDTRGQFGIRGVWCGASDAGYTDDAVEEFVQRLHEAHINLVAMCVKGVGSLYWPSRLFPETVAPEAAAFDMPAALLTECRKRGMQVHAWFIDFMESADGEAYRCHPEWAMLNAEGGTTATETLRGNPYHSVWMCPARRPGYADQWLIPLMREFAECYDFDAIHHDYIRYPGDLAPDRYCFCDDCLRRIPRAAGYLSQAMPGEMFYHESYDRPTIEAHWEQSPRVLPPNWDRLSRAMKSRFLLEGAFFAGGRNDLDYFYYLDRADVMAEFAREASLAIRSARPGMDVSAAVFKNPVHSGRFIGQDWRRFPPHVDIAMPMDYRDHYPGSFDTYLTLLAESIEQQKAWAREYRALWPGFAVNFLYFEEERPLRELAKSLESGAGVDVVRPMAQAADATLERFAPGVRARLRAWLGSGGDGTALAGEISALLKSPPPGFWPEDKVRSTIRTIRDTGVNGVCMFSAGLIDRYGMWDAVREEFAPDA